MLRRSGVSGRALRQPRRRGYDLRDPCTRPSSSRPCCSSLRSRTRLPPGSSKAWRTPIPDTLHPSPLRQGQAVFGFWAIVLVLLMAFTAGGREALIHAVVLQCPSSLFRKGRKVGRPWFARRRSTTSRICTLQRAHFKGAVGTVARLDASAWCDRPPKKSIFVSHTRGRKAGLELASPQFERDGVTTVPVNDR